MEAYATSIKHNCPPYFPMAGTYVGKWKGNIVTFSIVNINHQLTVSAKSEVETECQITIYPNRSIKVSSVDTFEVIG